MDLKQNAYSDESMIPLELSHFPENTLLKTSVFLKITSNKYLLLAKPGQNTQFADLHAFKDKKAKLVYITKNDITTLVQESLSSLEAKLSRKMNSRDGMTQLETDQFLLDLKNSSDLVLKEVLAFGVTENSFANCKMLSRSIREFAKQNRDIMSLVLKFKSMAGTYFEHSLMVATLSGMLGLELGWSSEGVLEKLALGGLLHDIGLQQLPHKLLTKSYDSMTGDEKSVYETHPYLGAQLIKSSPAVPPDIARIIFEHHENSVGEGYPRGLMDADISPHSKVVALVDKFCELVLPQLPGETAVKPEQALNYIENVLGQPFNSDCYRAFKAIFNRNKAQIKAQ